MSELWNKLKDQFTDHDDDDDMMEEDMPPRPASVNPAGIPAAPVHLLLRALDVQRCRCIRQSLIR